MLGVILMRFAAVLFIRLLERFPRFETSAYLLVILIGFKLMADWGFNPDPDHPDWRFNFHSYHSPGFWMFWLLMLAFFCVGFLPARDQKQPVPVVEPPPVDRGSEKVSSSLELDRDEVHT
jgi:predicted tellurium resistance membrane protein TerC